MRFALNALPETFINILQSFVSARRIEKYLALAEVTPVAPLGEQNLAIAFNSATVSWPQERAGGSGSASAGGSVTSTPGKRFVLIDLNLRFPSGELTLVCGKLGSGKSLLLLCELHWVLGWLGRCADSMVQRCLARRIHLRARFSVRGRRLTLSRRSRQGRCPAKRSGSSLEYAPTFLRSLGSRTQLFVVCSCRLYFWTRVNLTVS